MMLRVTIHLVGNVVVKSHNNVSWIELEDKDGDNVALFIEKTKAEAIAKIINEGTANDTSTNPKLSTDNSDGRDHLG